MRAVNWDLCLRAISRLKVHAQLVEGPHRWELEKKVMEAVPPGGSQPVWLRLPQAFVLRYEKVCHLLGEERRIKHLEGYPWTEALIRKAVDQHHPRANEIVLGPDRLLFDDPVSGDMAAFERWEPGVDRWKAVTHMGRGWYGAEAEPSLEPARANMEHALEEAAEAKAEAAQKRAEIQAEAEEVESITERVPVGDGARAEDWDGPRMSGD